MAKKKNSVALDHRQPQDHRQFTSEWQNAVSEGFVAYNQNGEVFYDPSSSMYCCGFGDSVDSSNPVLQRMNQEIMQGKTYDIEGNEIQGACSCGYDGRRGGLLMGTDATMLDWSQNVFVKVDSCGTEGLGYAVWGPFNVWPVVLYRAASSMPLTAAVIDYLERTLFGLGPQIVYCISRYSGGTVTHEEVPYKDAEVYLKEYVRQCTDHLLALLDEEGESVMMGDENHPQFIDLLEGIETNKPTMRQAYLKKRIEAAEKQLKNANEQLDSYWKTRSEIDKFLDNNNISYFFKRWINDCVLYGICFPMVGLTRSGAGKWEPKICNIEMREACVMRLEERNPANKNKIDYVYESERWREDGNCQLRAMDYVAHPAIMPEHALGDLRSLVVKNHRTRVGQRPCWICCPNYTPTPTKPYYPQMPWWSIFPSQVYQYASTIIYDKAAAKKNSTMWGKILFINTAYLAQIFNQAGEEGKTAEGQAKIRRGIYNNVEQFLKRRDNNGKLLVMDSYPSADEKQMIDSIRIVDVPQNVDSKASISELTEMASLVSYPCGVNMDLIGSRPGTQANSTGTAQRELHLLKNGQLAPDRVTFTDFFNKFIFPFNDYDSHFRMIVNYPTLTTLDNSKTGTVDMHDGK